MLGKPRILSLFPNSFNKFNKNMSTHVRSSLFSLLLIFEKMQAEVAVQADNQWTESSLETAWTI